MQRRRAWGGRVSDWQDPLDRPMAEVASSFGRRVPRSDVAPVEAIRDALGLSRPRLTVVVVGSNGKTSTATYLSDLFSAAGCRTGLFTSPHIAYWTERVRVDDLPVDGEVLVEAVAAVNELAQNEEFYDERLRFFDVLTLAAARVFGDAGVDVAVYEAGIGGRVDATRCLRPELVVLTAVGLEHTALLGETEEEILAAKLDVAPPGSTVVAGALAEHLSPAAREHAARIDVNFVDAAPPAPPSNGLPWYLAHNWSLARSAAAVGLERFGAELPEEASPRELYGRFTDISRGDVEYLVDVAHNPQAWEAFLGELRERLGEQRAAAVVSITRERPLEQFAEAIAASGLFSVVYATAASVRPTHDTEAVAAALMAAGQAAESCPQPSRAFERATAEARSGTVAIFGSSYLVTDALWWLKLPPRHD